MSILPYIVCLMYCTACSTRLTTMIRAGTSCTVQLVLPGSPPWSEPVHRVLYSLFYQVHHHDPSRYIVYCKCIVLVNVQSGLPSVQSIQHVDATNIAWQDDGGFKTGSWTGVSSVKPVPLLTIKHLFYKEVSIIPLLWTAETAEIAFIFWTVCSATSRIPISISF